MGNMHNWTDLDDVYSVRNVGAPRLITISDSAPLGMKYMMVNLSYSAITTAVVATIAGALINAWLESRRERPRAFALSLTLEGYAITCAEAHHNEYG
jgi:hypothetical protein